jgi:hypothetical protein
MRRLSPIWVLGLSPSLTVCGRVSSCRGRVCSSAIAAIGLGGALSPKRPHPSRVRTLGYYQLVLKYQQRPSSLFQFFQTGRVWLGLVF